MQKTILAFMLMFTVLAYSQGPLNNSKDITINKFVDGTLLLPRTSNALSLAIIIPGSGPTDRNGNQNFLKNNALKKLAEGLADNDIASFRMDKRTVKQIKQGNYKLNISFDDYVTDVKSIIKHFSEDNRFQKIFIIGHSQGSLVGLLAIDDNIDGFISLAGAGRSIDKVLIEQVEKTAPMFTEDTKRVLEILSTGQTTTDYPEALASFLNKDIQPFMMSWIKYDPTELIAEISVPILIINGTKDLQVSVEEAKMLNDSSKNSELKIIEDMNHVLFIIDGDDLVNSKSYNEPNRKISTVLLESIASFINK